jgi:hypothetical protein
LRDWCGATFEALPNTLHSARTHAAKIEPRQASVPGLN